ncbi:MAG: hypothetical protein ACREQ5_23110 [Candidatus Dormibacteria bacterium]
MDHRGAARYRYLGARGSAQLPEVARSCASGHEWCRDARNGSRQRCDG